jgi:acyl-CoA reductase-like NAD-dependent aldehyde dehydrogenase
MIINFNSMKQYLIFSGGEFIDTPVSHPVSNKYTGKGFAKTFLAGEKELDKAISAAQKAKSLCRNLTSMEKFNALRFISGEIEKNKKHLAEVLSIESGKPMIYAMAEIMRSVQTFLVASEESKRLPKEFLSLDWTENGRNKSGLVSYFPVGIIAGISPFNYPMNLAVHKIAPAIAAGCPIILKPASATPLSTLELARIISETQLPHGAVSILPMDRKTGNLLVTDERINMLSFTGSPSVGWELKKQSGKKRVVLELGGNAGVIISGDVKLTEIIDTCMTGAFSYSGQICIHAQRFFVHHSRFAEFAELMRKETERLKYGDPLDESTRISPMIDEENARRVEEWVNESVKGGARLICGGKREGAYYHPTILTNTRTDMKICAEEVFGPVITIESYGGDIAEAVDKINDTRFGLQCGIFTDSVAELDYVFNHADVGGVIHNNVPTLRFDQMPYGGIKESGLGREGVKYAIRDMMEAKVLVK